MAVTVLKNRFLKACQPLCKRSPRDFNASYSAVVTGSGETGIHVSSFVKKTIK